MKFKTASWILILTGAVLALVGVAVIATPYTYDLETAEGVTLSLQRPSLLSDWLARAGEVVLPLLDPGDTIYAKSFTEEAFTRIHVGATQEDVLAGLGEPLATKSFNEPLIQREHPGSKTVWYYSRHGAASKSYFVRALLIDGNGRVAKKFREYSVD